MHKEDFDPTDAAEREPEAAGPAHEDVDADETSASLCPAMRYEFTALEVVRPISLTLNRLLVLGRALFLYYAQPKLLVVYGPDDNRLTRLGDCLACFCGDVQADTEPFYRQPATDVLLNVDGLVRAHERLTAMVTQPSIRGYSDPETEPELERSYPETYLRHFYVYAHGWDAIRGCWDQAAQLASLFPELQLIPDMGEPLRAIAHVTETLHNSFEGEEEGVPAWVPKTMTDLITQSDAIQKCERRLVASGWTPSLGTEAAPQEEPSVPDQDNDRPPGAQGIGHWTQRMTQIQMVRRLEPHADSVRARTIHKYFREAFIREVHRDIRTGAEAQEEETGEKKSGTAKRASGFQFWVDENLSPNLRELADTPSLHE